MSKLEYSQTESEQRGYLETWSLKLMRRIRRWLALHIKGVNLPFQNLGHRPRFRTIQEQEECAPCRGETWWNGRCWSARCCGQRFHTFTGYCYTSQHFRNASAWTIKLNTKIGEFVNQLNRITRNKDLLRVSWRKVNSCLYFGLVPINPIVIPLKTA